MVEGSIPSLVANKMNFKEYQDEAKKTAVYKAEDAFIYLTLGIAGEAGEVAEKVKKIIRDKNSKLEKSDKQEIIKELGDCLWYLANLSDILGFTFEEVAEVNLQKLKSRAVRNRLHGDGDNR